MLACDASAYGLGVLLVHKYPNGSEHPIAYASRTLTKAERNYSQLEKEGFACIFVPLHHRHLRESINGHFCYRCMNTQ